MWFIQPKRDYVAEMPWRHADEPAVMAWQIRTRDYYTFPANIILLIMSCISLMLGLWFAFGWGVESIVSKMLLCGGVFSFGVLITMSMTHQTAIIVYRLTDKRIEVFSWKPQIDSVKPVMKWTAIISGVVVLFLVLVSPNLIIAAIGPVSIVIMAALMGNSKDYQSMARNELHYEFDWGSTKKLYFYKKRNIIGLNIHWHNPDVDKLVTEDIRPVFCNKENLEDCLAYFTKRLPDVPVLEESFDVHH
ncbi:hypothetical protein [Halomonas sp. HL-93]|uniref:hypothetical protein n=1 Tax=Halomonas sp. HL-93 TaxID=1666906 RepID=UPI0007F089CB|nr:hypothetical protein [Halomonas sp. HL-93]SBR49382.1 hypothetical protein GA0071314_2179 [Halomonas sp. HL-93]